MTVPATMRAIRVHAPGDATALTLDTVPVPRPGPGHALVQVEWAGINFIEVYQRKGLYPLPLPFTVGSEGAGTVVAVGDGVTAVRVGDRVASQSLAGSHAEYAVAAAERLIVLPDGVSTKDGAALMLQGLTAHYLLRSTYRLQSGDVALVHAAAGGVGLLLCQIASGLGAHVIGTVSTEEKELLARAAGARDVIRYTEQDFVAETKRITGGAGVHVVYDSVGATTFLSGFEVLRPRGTMVLFGQSSGPVAPFDPQLLNRHGSLFVTRPSLNHYVATAAELRERATELLAWVRDGQLTLRVGGEWELADARLAHEALEGRETTGKVLLRVAG